MRHETPSFVSFPADRAGIVFDNSDHKKFPIAYWHIIDGFGMTPNKDRSYYGYVISGSIALENAEHTKTTMLSEGQFFSRVGDFQFAQWAKGSAIVVEVFHKEGVYPETKYSAMSLYGGPIENIGRLKYIDQCTDSVLINPIKLGDPCLNHLHFPKNIVQTMHVHPSHRIGVVARGEGRCITPFGELPLTTGMIFVIKESDGVETAVGLDGKEYLAGSHCFNTEDSELDVIAFHPDSDFGATDINHPMINRTIVNGISANAIPYIQTHDE